MNAKAKCHINEAKILRMHYSYDSRYITHKPHPKEFPLYIRYTFDLYSEYKLVNYRIRHCTTPQCTG